MGSDLGVGKVKLELQNLVDKHYEPLVKLRAEGVKERVDRAPANRWQVAVAQKQSRAERVRWRGSEMEWKEGGKKLLLLDTVMQGIRQRCMVTAASPGVVSPARASDRCGRLSGRYCSQVGPALFLIFQAFQSLEL
jgi:hypothetical protein